MPWTTEQQNAIDARRGTVLVSAAAGSGKTAVLVERVIRRLRDPVSPTDADRLLIVTFTKAAAAEMKERIAARLAAMLEERPDDRNLKRQQVLLRRANISTIHSFCSRVVKEYFYKLDISPDFTIADQGELAILREQALSDVLAAGYDDARPAFHRLVEAFSTDRDDKKLGDTILQVYDFTRAHPFPDQWMAETAAQYDDSLSIEETVWGKTVLRYMEDVVSHCIALTETAISLLDTEAPLQKAYGPALESDLAMLRDLAQVCRTGGWDAVVAAVENRSFAKLGSARGYSDDPLANQVKALRQTVKDTLQKKLVPRLFPAGDCKSDIARHGVLIRELFSLVADFDRRLGELKAKKKTADFDDLERWTLQLLYEERDGQFVPTDDARRIADQFDEIIVDEYQDTNLAQDRIFRAISKDESNLFLVGDVKQSIYGFRQAMPQIFIDRREAYPRYDPAKDQYPACVVLDQNFRSRKEVTDTVNFLFQQLMTKASGDVDYDEGESLKAGAVYPPQNDVTPVLDIIEADAVSDETLDEDMAVLEARQIATRISDMMGSGFLVTDRGVQRPVTYGDFAILLRSANNHMGKYVGELQASGIPAKAGKQPGFFQTAEVAVVLSLLRVISNPVQDIPLTSVLMSPIYGFTPDDMSDVRVADKKTPLYLALCQAAEQGMEKAKQFLSDLDGYRTLAATLPADRMINYLYETTGYPDLVQAMGNGERRLMNLQLLLEYARQFEGAGYRGVTGFVRFVDRLQRQKGDLNSAEDSQASDNAVQVMSIHNSKGLEFPVTILAGCSRRFNTTRDDALIHPTLGLGVKLRDQDLPCRYTTLMREAIAIADDRSSMAEELRVLYVALTRAREKLILVTTEKRLGNRLAGLTAGLNSNPQLDPYRVGSAASFSDWILTCALRHPDGGLLRELSGVDVPILRNDSVTPWEINRVLPQQGFAPEAAAQQEKPDPDPALLETLRQRLRYQYPYQALLDLPAKVTASALAEETSQKDRPLPDSLPRPAFLFEKGLTPAERGTATHQFMQFCQLAAARADGQQELNRLMAHGFLTAEQGAAVDFRKVNAFLQSNLCRRMEQADEVQREHRFTAQIPASLVDPTLSAAFPDQQVVLQGAVDCLFVEDGKLVIVDYKTDRISDPAALWARYEKQLALYAMAMEQCTGLPVKETLLYSFYLDKTIGPGGKLL